MIPLISNRFSGRLNVAHVRRGRRDRVEYTFQYAFARNNTLCGIAIAGVASCLG